MNDGLSLYASVMRNFVILFIFFALLDVPLAKALFTKGLKMTKQELKEEYKKSGRQAGSEGARAATATADGDGENPQSGAESQRGDHQPDPLRRGIAV